MVPVAVAVAVAVSEALVLSVEADILFLGEELGKVAWIDCLFLGAGCFGVQGMAAFKFFWARQIRGG
jgi:hypothetical protein